MDYDAIVVGGGIIGVAIARQLVLGGRRVALLEAERVLGSHASARNSEVVHAGIYYPPDSLKAVLCLRGRAKLLEYCATRAIPLRTPGKLIVACDDGERDALARIQANAAASGVALRWLEGAEVQRLEPAVACAAALLSPTTAIIDSHAFLTSLAAEVRDGGGDIVLGCRFTHATRKSGGWRVCADGESVTTRGLFLAGGADGPALARRVEGIEPAAIPAGHLAKGSYFAVVGGPAFTHLVYPVPVPGGLGIHVTLDLAGGVRLGPDVEWIDAVDHTVDPSRAATFAAAARRYVPALSDDTLRPAYAGVRAKIVGPGEPAADFLVRGPADLGVPGVVALFGIESPGLTAALALAEHAVAAAGDGRP